MTDLSQAFRELSAALRRGERVVCIHYACGNFFDVTDHPVAVTCIALSEPDDSGGARQEVAFSIANAKPSDTVEDRERDLLSRFYDEVCRMPDARFVHWNMNRAAYGFAAIGERYRYLFGEDPPCTFQTDRLYDLDSIIGHRFGTGFAKHPKLRNLASLNGLYMPFFKAGKDEADAIKTSDFGLIERSTAEKAHLIAQLAVRLCAGTLRTQGSVGAVAFAGEYLDAVALVTRLGERFLYVERALRRRYDKRPTLEVNDEYDAQDLLRAVLTLFFDDVRPESWTPSYAGGSSRIDFILPAFGLAVELKYTRDTLKDAELGAQLIIDRDRYAKHPDVSHLICLVFDHKGFISNPRGIEADLTRDVSTDEIAVTVKIIDR